MIRHSLVIALTVYQYFVVEFLNFPKILYQGLINISFTSIFLYAENEQMEAKFCENTA